MHNPLLLDEARTVAAIEAYLKKVVKERGVDGVLLGLSGGIDSALVATLAVRALGAERVHAVYLYDHLSSTALAGRCREVAHSLGIDLRERSIESDLRTRGNYRSFGSRMVQLSGWQNRLFLWASRLVLGETNHLNGLREDGSGELRSDGPFKRLLRHISRPVRATVNARHRYRLELAEAEAASRRLQFVGAGNRSEWLTGYFAKDGIDDVEIQPIGGLYKTQVRQLAAALGVPKGVRTQAPSPDAGAGITDELDMGISYRKMDLVLDHLADGLSRETIESAGCTDADMALVRKMQELSAWKREGRSGAFAVDGGPRSALRVAQAVMAT
jgi:NAD+ synthase